LKGHPALQWMTKMFNGISVPEFHSQDRVNFA